MKRLLVAAGSAVLVLSSAMAVAAHADTRGRARLSDQDKMFLDEAAGGARYEVLAGRQAADRAATTDVRQVGQRMVADHTREYEELSRVAKDVGRSIPDHPDHPLQRIVDLFGQLDGSRLDCAYTPQEFSDHENDIARFETESRHGSNAELRAFATRTLPTLRSHLEMVEKTLDAIRGC
jgi:putative membrane protein